MKRILVLLGIIGLIQINSLMAQEKAPSKMPLPGSPEAALLDLAKASQNPVADLNTVPFQFNWFSGGGLGNQTLSQTLIQPVFPLPISKDINVVSRTVVPVMSVPTSNGEKLKGIADIQEEIFFAPSHAKGLIWGFGPIFSLPTATVSVLYTGQFALGPNAVLLAMPGKFVLGAVINQMWRIGGSTSTTAINQFYTQPFINYNFKMGWSVSFAPAITANWAAPSGQQWTVPLGAGVSKVTVVGKQPLSLSFQYYHNVERPDDAGADQVKLQVSFLFPKNM